MFQNQRTYYKITNEFENHRHYNYKEGLNEFQGTFNKSSNCGYGGLYFAEAGDIFHFLTWGVYYRQVTLCNDSQVVEVTQHMGKKYKTDKFILGPRHEINLEFIERQIQLYKRKYKNIGCLDSLKLCKFLKLVQKNVDKDVLFEYIIKQFHLLFFIHRDYVFLYDLYDIIIAYLQQHYNDFVYIKKAGINTSHILKYMRYANYSQLKQVIELFPANIAYVENPSMELLEICYEQKPFALKRIQNCHHIENFLVENRLIYDLIYLNEIHSKYQVEIMNMDLYNIILISNPCPEVLDMIKNQEELQIYTDLFTNEEYKNNFLIDNCEQSMENFELLTKCAFCDIEKNVQLFIQKLHEFEACICGSFAAICIHNIQDIFIYDNYSDIDIYFNDEEKAYNFGESLKEIEYLRTNTLYYSSYSILGHNIKTIYVHEVIGPNKGNSPKIQIMVIRPHMNTINFLLTFIDIDHCKSVIEFKNNREMLFYKVNRDPLVTNVSEHIFNVFVLFRNNIQKYIENISNPVARKYHSKTITSMNFYMSKVKSRIRKYECRGLTIENIERFKECLQLCLQVIDEYNIENNKSLYNDVHNNVCNDVHNKVDYEEINIEPYIQEQSKPTIVKRSNNIQQLIDEQNDIKQDIVVKKKNKKKCIVS